MKINIKTTHIYNNTNNQKNNRKSSRKSPRNTKKRQSSCPNKNQKAQKKIINWPEYNRSLIKRGSLMISLDIKQVHQYKKPLPMHKIGRPYEYSDAIIELILMIKIYYHLPLRQATGFIGYIFGLHHISVAIPDYTTLSRRAKHLCPKLLDKAHYINRTDELVLAIDSTGMKVYGEGEWMVRKHGKNKRRTWTETHAIIDTDSRDVLAIINTSSDVHDSTQLLPLLIAATQNLQQVESNQQLKCLLGDGAYASHQSFNLLEQMGAELIAPVAKNSNPKIRYAYEQEHDQKGWEIRNAVVREVQKKGMEQWKQEKGYHKRSLIENYFSRNKRIFGDRTMLRNRQNQYTEQQLRGKILNMFNNLGLPRYNSI